MAGLIGPPGSRLGIVSNFPPVRSSLRIYALAGLEASTVGVLWMAVCFALAAIAAGDGIWAVPNLFATAFYGDIAYQGSFGRSTWAGMALMIVLYGLLGVAWSCVVKGKRRPFLGVAGALTGLAVYYLFFHLIWNFADPLIPLYAPIRQFQVAHALWGAALSSSPRYARRIADILTPQPAASFEEPAPIVSGEILP